MLRVALFVVFLVLVFALGLVLGLVFGTGLGIRFWDWLLFLLFFCFCLADWFSATEGAAFSCQRAVRPQETTQSCPPSLILAQIQTCANMRGCLEMGEPPIPEMLSRIEKQGNTQHLKQCQQSMLTFGHQLSWVRPETGQLFKCSLPVESSLTRRPHNMARPSHPAEQIFCQSEIQGKEGRRCW